MTDAYEAWQECRERLDEEPDSTFLRTVEESLRPTALLDYLASFRGMDGSEEPLGCDAETAEIFLVGLDELRQPTVRPDEVRAEVARQVDDVLHKMRDLNWTGDHLYGDALDDARVIVRHVLSDKKGWPVLERFRCPSLFQAGKRNKIQCQLQLPHGDKHEWARADSGLVTWTDEQSVNPPKPYDAPLPNPCGVCQVGRICTLPAMHSGPHHGQDGVEWEDTRKYCGVSHDYSDASKSATLYCRKPKYHEGEHQAPSGETWAAAPGDDGQCPEWLNAAEMRGRCTMHAGHRGPSHYDALSGSSWAVS